MRWRTREALSLLVPVLAAFLAFAPSLGYRFTYDDGFHALTPEEDTRTFVDVWTTPYWWPTGYGGLYRPVATLIFWAENQAQVPYAVRHAVNVTLHVLVTGLVVVVGRRLGLGALAAGAAGTLFAIHPVHVEVVAGLVGRAESLAALFMLLALALHDRGPRAPALKVLLAAALAFLGAGAKESAFTLAFCALAMDVARRRRVLAAWPAYAGYGVGLAAHMALRYSVLGGFLNEPSYTPVAFDNHLILLHGGARLLGALRLVGLNLAHLVFPGALSPDYSGPSIDLGGSAADPRLWGGVLLLLGPVVLALWAYPRARRQEPGAVALATGSVWLLFSVLLFMNLIYPLGTILADRILYWPTVAWVFLVAGLGERLRAAWTRWAWAALVLALAVGYGVRLAGYLPAWKDNRALFETAVKEAPRSARVWFNMGRVDHVEGRKEEALASYEKAVALDPTYHFAWSHEGIVLVELGRYEEARRAFNEALRYSPGDLVSLTNDGVALAHLGNYPGAVERYRQVLAMRPRHAEALINLAKAEDELKNYEAARDAWVRYLAERPEDAKAKNDLAWLLAVNLGRPREAEPLAREAVAGAPQEPQHRDTLAETLFRLGRREDALAAEREAAALDTSAYFREQLRRFETAPLPESGR